MRILMVNGNRTGRVTDLVVGVARGHARPGTTVEGVTARFGADIVTAEPENIIAAHAVLDLLAAHHAGYDAAVLAISFDSGLFAARDLIPIPVVGMTEAALNAAASHGGKVGVILFGRASLPLYEAHFARVAAGRSIATIRVVDIASVTSYLDPEAQAIAIRAEIAAIERETGLGDIVICGAAMAGLAARLQSACDARLHDGIVCGLREAERLVIAGEGRPAPRDALARSGIVTGLSPALAAAFAARNAGQ